MREVNAIITIAARDITKLLRDRTRLAANFIFPAIFIGVLGTSLQSNLGTNLGYNFLTFVLIGVIAQTLFQSTASGIISLLEDRQNDFAQELFISPISRYSIIIGKILGETIVSLIQTVAVLILGIVIQVPLDPMALLRVAPFGILVSLMGGAFGVIVMSRISEQRSANQIFPFLLFPQFFLAGVFNPIQNLPLPILIISRLAPMTYAVDLLRAIYFYGKPEYSKVVLFSPVIDITVVTVFFIFFMILGTHLFVQKEKNR